MMIKVRSALDSTDDADNDGHSCSSDNEKNQFDNQMLIMVSFSSHLEPISMQNEGATNHCTKAQNIKHDGTHISVSTT